MVDAIRREVKTFGTPYTSWVIELEDHAGYCVGDLAFKQNYEPVDAEAAAEWKRIYVEDHPPVSEKDNLTDLNQKVQEGMQIALDAVADPQLKGLCRSLLNTWDNLMSQVIIVSVGLSAMRFRTPEQIEAQLIRCQEMFRTSIERSGCMCKGNETEH